MKANNGGPAFPSQHTIEDGAFNPHTGTVAKGNQVYIELGASLRDYFAAKALQGYLASFDSFSEPVEFASKIAEDCYRMADAMLAERAKGGEA